jgi:hypothetical protein
MKYTYNNEFYATYSDDSQTSAREVIRILAEYIRPQSVADVGCGIGTWLSIWQEKGIDQLLGIDGNYINPSMLLINPIKFMILDLADITADAFESLEKYDLAMSLEVAEHIPQDRAEAFIDFLCSLSDIVLFSAAIPFQGGTYHINEQWPEYWAQKFTARGYLCADLIRSRVWNNDRCAYYYAQNTLLYIHHAVLDRYPPIKEITQTTNINSLALVHPKKWIHKNHELVPLEKLLLTLPASLINFFKRAFNRIFRLMSK